MKAGDTNNRWSDTALAAWVYFADLSFVVRRRIDERGATSVEYALMAMFIAVGIITSVSVFTKRVGNMFNTYSNTIPS